MNNFSLIFAEYISEIQLTLDKHLKHFKLYDFLWKDDMKGNFNEFMSSSPHTNQLQSEVQRMCDIQNAVTSIPIVIINILIESMS